MFWTSLLIYYARAFCVRLKPVVWSITWTNKVDVAVKFSAFADKFVSDKFQSPWFQSNVDVRVPKALQSQHVTVVIMWKEILLIQFFIKCPFIKVLLCELSCPAVDILAQIAFQRERAITEWKALNCKRASACALYLIRVTWNEAKTFPLTFITVQYQIINI